MERVNCRLLWLCNKAITTDDTLVADEQAWANCSVVYSLSSAVFNSVVPEILMPSAI